MGLGTLATERRRARLESYLKHLVAAVARETVGGRKASTSATGAGRALATLANFLGYDPETGVPTPAAAAAAEGRAAVGAVETSGDAGAVAPRLSAAGYGSSFATGPDGPLSVEASTAAVLAQHSKAHGDLREEVAVLRAKVKSLEREVSGCETSCHRVHSFSARGSDVPFLPLVTDFYRPVAIGAQSPDHDHHPQRLDDSAFWLIVAQWLLFAAAMALSAAMALYGALLMQRTVGAKLPLDEVSCQRWLEA